MNNNRTEKFKTLGPRAAYLVGVLYERGKPVFSSADVIDITGLKPKSARNEKSKELVYVRPVTDGMCSENDEISLIDLWLVLTRHKWLIIGITVLGVVLGMGYTVWKPVVYEYRTGLELAKIYSGPGSDGLKLLSSREGSIVLLRDLINPEQRKSLFEDEEIGPQVEVVQRGDDFSLGFKSTAKPAKAMQVEKLHKAVADALAEQQAPRFKKKIEVMCQPFIEQADMLRKQKETLNKQLQQLSVNARKANGVARMVDAQQMGHLREELGEIRVKLVEATSSEEMIRKASEPTMISYLAVESESPVGAGKPLVVFLALGLGLLVGLFVAFFSEFLNNARAAKAREQREI